MNARWLVRSLSVDDVEGITRVQLSAYEPRYHESAESFRAKVDAGDGACFGVFDPELVAYVVALPCHPGVVMPLDAVPTWHMPLAEASCLYVHDLAVAVSHRGRRLGDVLWHQLVGVARERGIGSVELVSVQNSVVWWEARGFAVTGEAEGGYGAEAVRMAVQIA
jgi:ribosomal protein S18 acetylase RimI-like enzyme